MSSLLDYDVMASIRDHPMHDLLQYVLSTAQSLYGPLYPYQGRSPAPPPDVSHTASLFPPNVPNYPGAYPGSERGNLSDAEIFSMTQSIKDQEASRRPLVAPTVPLSVLRSEYTSPTYLAKIEWLSAHGWSGLRRSRGDGDCFYRSMAFAYVERILNAPDLALAVATSLSTLEASLNDLKQVGFEPLVYEDFYEVLRDLVLNIVEPDREGKVVTPATLLQRFQDPEISNSIVVFLRLLTSAHMRLNADDFVPFLFDPETVEPVSVRHFCETQVEATGREADHPQVLALSRALKVSIDVAYVDGSITGGGAVGDGAQADEGRVDFVQFDTEAARGNGTVPITLLYRPGHYDILEKKSVEPEE